MEVGKEVERMKRIPVWIGLFLLLAWVVAPVGPAWAQTLDEMMERPGAETGMIKVPALGGTSGTPSGATSGSSDQRGAGLPWWFQPIRAEDLVLGVRTGFCSIEPLIGFLRNLIARLIEAIAGATGGGQPVPPVAGGRPGSDGVPPATPLPSDGGDDGGPGSTAPPGSGDSTGQPGGSTTAGPMATMSDPLTALPGTTGGTSSAETGEGPGTTVPGFTGFPPRPAGAETGSEFLARTEPLSPARREEEIKAAILAGNVPDFLRRMCEVRVAMRLRDGQEHTVFFRTLPDYLCIGIDTDFVRIPMSPIAAQAIADRFGCILPTSKITDDIYRHAQTQLYPQPMSGGQYPDWQARMTKNEFYREHHRLVEGQRSRSGHQPGQLLAGHKKDVLVSNFLNTHPRNVVIYGWHDKRNQGKPIQGYGFSHENTYADYSHGIRLISKAVLIDRQERPIAEVLADPLVSRLLSNEGPVRDTRAVR